MFLLAKTLGKPHYAAVGIVQNLFDLASEYAKPGNIGRYSDEMIASFIGWEHDPAELIDALVECGWLDRCAQHRLRVHDWLEHCDTYIRNWVQENAPEFMPDRRDAPAIESENLRDDSRKVRKVPKKSRPPTPLPTPEKTHTTPEPAAPAVCVESIGKEAEELVSSFWSSFGSPRDPDAGEIRHAQKLLDRFGPDVIAIVPKAAAKAKQKFPGVQKFGGAVCYVEELLATGVKRDRDKRQRDDQAERRRQDSEAAEAARQRRQALWRDLPEDERQQWRDQVKGELPLIFDSRQDLVEVMASAKFEEQTAKGAQNPGPRR